MTIKSEYTEHAEKRSMQRGIPPLISQWLRDYGDRHYDGHGCVLRYFSHESKRRIQRDVGREPVRRLREYLRCYLVEAVDNNQIVTIGKMYEGKRFNRR